VEERERETQFEMLFETIGITSASTHDAYHIISFNARAERSRRGHGAEAQVLEVLEALARCHLDTNSQDHTEFHSRGARERDHTAYEFQ